MLSNLEFSASSVGSRRYLCKLVSGANRRTMAEGEKHVTCFMLKQILGMARPNDFGSHSRALSEPQSYPHNVQ